MRRRRPDLTARVNGNLALEFGPIQLTSYAGLELFGRYLQQIGFNALVRDVFVRSGLGGDFGPVAMVRVLMALLVVGGRRLRHVAFLHDDPLVRRFSGLRVVPTARTLSRWLQRFTMRTVARVQALNAAVVTQMLTTLNLATLTIDIDGTVVSTGLQVERAFRGFNPHHRKVPSYYPILAHVAETTHILRVKNRSGNIPDGKAGVPFLREVWTQLSTGLSRAVRVRVRMDGAFFREDVLRWLQARHVGYAVKVPFYRWLNLQTAIREHDTWQRVAAEVAGFQLREVVTPWGLPLSVAVFRKRVHHRSPKNYQLDLFDPNDGHYEYSAVTSNLDLGLPALWQFMCGRGGHEKTIGELKHGLAFGSVPTASYAANSAWQQLVALTHNLLVNFQLATGAAARPRTRKRTVLHTLQRIQTLRFVLFQRAGLLVRPAGADAVTTGGQPGNPRPLHADRLGTRQSGVNY